MVFNLEPRRLFILAGFAEKPAQVGNGGVGPDRATRANCRPLTPAETYSVLRPDFESLAESRRALRFAWGLY